MVEVLVLLSGDTSCYIQGLRSAVYYLVRMQHGKVIILLIVNVHRHIVRELEDRLVPGHGEVSICILKSLELHEMILRDQESELDVRPKDTSAFQY